MRIWRLLVLRSRSWRKGLKPVFIAVAMFGALSGAAAVGVAQTEQDPGDPPSSLLGKGNDFAAAELRQSLEMAANDLRFWLRVTSGDLSECTSPTCGVVDVKFNIERIAEYCGNIPRAARRLAAFDAKEHGALAQAIDSACETLEAEVTRLGIPSDTPSWRDLARELSRELADAIAASKAASPPSTPPPSITPAATPPSVKRTIRVLPDSTSMREAALRRSRPAVAIHCSCSRLGGELAS